MPLPLITWQHLLDPTHTDLLQQAAACGLANLTTITKLRKHHDADLAAAALQLAEARRRATVKFPDHAATLLADVEGVEQASSMLVASHKAKRFADLATRTGLHTAIDFCSGIGGDTIALVHALNNATLHGLNNTEINTTPHVIAIDADPVRAWMTEQNAGCSTQCIDVESWVEFISLADADQRMPVYHIDPARRSSTGRAWDLADYTPGPEFLRTLMQRLPTGAIKLGPGINLNELAAELTDHLPAHELEFISEHGRLVQAVLWTGEFITPNEAGSTTPHTTTVHTTAPHATARRTATLLPANATLTGNPGEPPIDDIEQYLYTVDAAAERAQLLHVLCSQLNLHAIHPALGMLTSPALIESPWLTAFEFIEELPWRVKKVKAWLRDHNAGIVEVKTRSKAANPDEVQKQLRGKGNAPFTVFILRFDEQLRAIITRRIPQPLAA